LPLKFGFLEQPGTAELTSVPGGALMVAVSLPVPSTFTVRTVSRIDRIAADLRLLFFAEAPRGSLNVRVAPKATVWLRHREMTQRSSRPEESHPRALPDPCVNLSIHTAPDARPCPWHSCQ